MHACAYAWAYGFIHTANTYSSPDVHRAELLYYYPLLAPSALRDAPFISSHSQIQTRRMSRNPEDTTPSSKAPKKCKQWFQRDVESSPAYRPGAMPSSDDTAYEVSVWHACLLTCPSNPMRMLAGSHQATKRPYVPAVSGPGEHGQMRDRTLPPDAGQQSHAGAQLDKPATSAATEESSPMPGDPCELPRYGSVSLWQTDHVGTTRRHHSGRGGSGAESGTAGKTPEGTCRSPGSQGETLQISKVTAERILSSRLPRLGSAPVRDSVNTAGLPVAAPPDL